MNAIMMTKSVYTREYPECRSEDRISGVESLRLWRAKDGFIQVYSLASDISSAGYNVRMLIREYPIFSDEFENTDYYAIHSISVSTNLA